MGNGACFHDEHGKVTSALLQPVPGINESRKAIVTAVFLHIELYVPSAADIPAPAREEQKQQCTQGREAHALPAGGGQSRCSGIGAGDAERGLQDRNEAALAREDGCAGKVDGELRCHTGAACRRVEED